MSGAMLHGLGDCTLSLNCGCMDDLSRSLGVQTPEQETAHLKAEVQRLKEEKLAWKRRALVAEAVQARLLADDIRGDR